MRIILFVAAIIVCCLLVGTHAAGLSRHTIYSSLFMSAGLGERSQIVDLFFKHGHLPNVRNSYGQSLLDVAKLSGDQATIDLVATAEKQLGAHFEERSMDVYWTPIVECHDRATDIDSIFVCLDDAVGKSSINNAKAGFVNMAVCLTDHAADGPLDDTWASCYVEMMSSNAMRFNVVDSNGRTPFHHAVLAQSYTMLRIFSLVPGLVTETFDTDGKSPLDAALAIGDEKLIAAVKAISKPLCTPQMKYC